MHGRNFYLGLGAILSCHSDPAGAGEESRIVVLTEDPEWKWIKDGSPRDGGINMTAPFVT
jgi:hypothetical protein